MGAIILPYQIILILPLSLIIKLMEVMALEETPNTMCAINTEGVLAFAMKI